jgi:hypothetical protein
LMHLYEHFKEDMSVQLRARKAQKMTEIAVKKAIDGRNDHYSDGLLGSNLAMNSNLKIRLNRSHKLEIMLNCMKHMLSFFSIKYGQLVFDQKVLFQ